MTSTEPNVWKNKLYFGDNLRIMRELIPDDHIDLIYLDPPFNSRATYNVLFQEKNGSQSRAQITAFEDTWHWGTESEEAFHDIVTCQVYPLSRPSTKKFMVINTPGK